MPTDTPLATLLFRSHAALVLLSIVALVVPIAGLLYTRSLLSRVIEVEMLDVDAEEAVHRAAWQVEVSARHASRVCLANPAVAPSTIVPDIVAADRALEAALARHGGRASPMLLRPARAYHALVADVGRDTCRTLGRVAAARLALDEELTDAWIDQLRALHRAIAESEREARR
ncbi:MAG: Two-component system sensor histidine kinase/response regulator, hybrid, partial [Myxococcaceae bacterium]|nr:Two-component system sensor histidine kinase/response regulator, hybrid [Myxococcaceae bacterium]